MWAETFFLAGSQTENQEAGNFFLLTGCWYIRSYSKVLHRETPQFLSLSGLSSVRQQTFPSLRYYYQVFCWNKKCNWYKQHKFVYSNDLVTSMTQNLKVNPMSQNAYPFKISQNTNISFIKHLFLMLQGW